MAKSRICFVIRSFDPSLFLAWRFDVEFEEVADALGVGLGVGAFDCDLEGLVGPGAADAVGTGDLAVIAEEVDHKGLGAGGKGALEGDILIVDVDREVGGTAAGSGACEVDEEGDEGQGEEGDEEVLEPGELGEEGVGFELEEVGHGERHGRSMRCVLGGGKGGWPHWAARGSGV